MRPPCLAKRGREVLSGEASSDVERLLFAIVRKRLSCKSGRRQLCKMKCELKSVTLLWKCTLMGNKCSAIAAV